MILLAVTAAYHAAVIAANGSATQSAGVEIVRYDFASDEDRDFDGLPDDWLRRLSANTSLLR